MIVWAKKSGSNVMRTIQLEILKSLLQRKQVRAARMRRGARKVACCAGRIAGKEVQKAPSLILSCIVLDAIQQ